jgi:hypothetical protein
MFEIVTQEWSEAPLPRRFSTQETLSISPELCHSSSDNGIGRVIKAYGACGDSRGLDSLGHHRVRNRRNSLKVEQQAIAED